MDITTIITYLKDLLATVLTLFMMMSPAFGTDVTTYTAENPDALVTSFAVVSDIHVETNNPESYTNLKNVLEGIKIGADIDAVVYTGDNVMNGQELESILFYSAIKAVMPAEKNIVLPGNHDYGNGEGDYELLRQNYLSNNTLYLGETHETDYFYNVVNGCYMISLVSEDPTTEDFMMGTAQFEWLEGVLKEANEADAPIFVFNHFPLRYLDKGNESYNTIDKAELGALLVEYDADIFVHGHIHDHLGTDNFYTSYGVDSINLPRCTETTDYGAGDGIVFEVYEDNFVVKGRNFINGEWIDGLRYEYSF